MLRTLIELALAPMLVAAAGVAARRWGPRVGGVVSAFPAIVGPVLLISALDHGARFAARAADGTLLGLVALSAFALSYARVATRAGWVAALLVAWSVAALSASATGLLAGLAAPPAGLLVAVVSLLAAGRLLSPGDRSLADPTSFPGLGSLPLRMLATAVLVGALSALASAFGAIIGGILAALPVLASVLAVATHRRQGAQAVSALFKGMLVGMFGFVAFCEVLVLMLAPGGILLAFGAAAVGALAVQGAAVTAAVSAVRLREAQGARLTAV